MNNKLLVIICFSILLIFIFYKLYNNNYNNNLIENFGVLEKMKNISKKKKKNKFTDISSKKKTSFDDLFTASEKFNPNNNSLETLSKKISDYKDSFKSSKFKNNSTSTAEAFEKFALYKEKFFEIFK